MVLRTIMTATKMVMRVRARTRGVGDSMPKTACCWSILY